MRLKLGGARQNGGKKSVSGIKKRPIFIVITVI